jgi:hypothetical protein
MASTQFSPDQDMSDVSPEDVQEAKMRAKASKAYDAAQTYPKKMASGGNVSSASKRADGIASKGKTRGTMVSMCGGGMYKGKK